MTVLIILLLLLLGILIWLLLVPIQIIADSSGPFLTVRIVSIGSAMIFVEENTPFMRLRGFFMSKDILFSDMVAKSRISSEAKKESKEAKGKKKKKKGRKTGISSRKVRWLLRLFRIPGSFRIRKLYVDIDTGDYILNAYMYPVFVQLDGLKPGWNWQINYLGQIQVYLMLQSSLIRMIYRYFR